MTSLLLGDCVELMREMPAASVDAIVTDPPYGLGFMGKAWDDLPPGREWAEACLRVLKPGGHLLAFGGTRTHHRLACAVEDAGFEIRDTICWLYGSGFPKSHNIGGGRGTALKPAHEPVVVARKPLKGTVAENVLEHGTGALNVDGCRVEYEPNPRHEKGGSYATRKNGSAIFGAALTEPTEPTPAGRWPANVVLDEEAAVMMDDQTGPCRSAGEYVKGSGAQGNKTGAASIPIDGLTSATYGDKGGASRFFYCAKASRSERGADNRHPTVKPLKLMCWLVRLVTPPGGVVLDPFAGSGTTGIAAQREGFQFIGLERELEYVELARERIRRDNPLANGLAA